MTKTKVVVVGCGNVAESYIPKLLENAFVEVVALCDSRENRVRELAAQFGIQQWFADVDTLLENVSADLFVNLTSMSLHYPLNKKAIEAGLNVWCEKPIALSYKEAKELIDLSAQRGLKIWCAPNSPTSPAFQFMAKGIADGRLGKVTAANGVYGYDGPWWSKWFYQKGGGVLLDLGVYNITTLTGLLGPAKSVMAMMGVAVPERMTDEGMVQVEAEDNVAIVIEHANGVYSTVQTSFVYGKQRDDWTIQVMGTKGAMSMRGYDWEPRGVDLYDGSSGWVLEAEDQQGYHWAGGAADVAECMAKGIEPIMQCEHAVHVMEVMEAARTSSENGERIKLASSFRYPMI
jgi:predicted dehydrogenase